MKLSLVNLVPLKELKFDSPAPEGMDIPNFDSLVDALKWKNDLENYSMDLENELKHAQRQFDDKLSGQGERGAEPEGGPIQQKIAGELDQIKSNIQTFKKELNTISSKIDYFDQNYLGEGDYADRLANSGTDSDGRNTWGDKTGYSDEEMAQGKGKLKKYPDKDGRNVWGDKVDYSDEEKAKSLKEIDLNAISAKKASFVYTEQGGRFYSLTLSTSDGQTLKMKYDEANEWLKDTLAYIHEGDLLPRRYNSGLEDLDLIVARLGELNINAKVVKMKNADDTGKLDEEGESWGLEPRQ